MSILQQIIQKVIQYHGKGFISYGKETTRAKQRPSYVRK